MKLAKTFSVLLCAAFMCACVSDLFTTLCLNQERHNGTCSVGDTVEISIPSNPTTGFDWRYAMDGYALLFKETKYLPDNDTDTMLTGSGGVKTFYFVANKPGLAVVTLRYGRPWEGTFIKEEIFKIAVK